MSVTAAVRRELKSLAGVDKGASQSALAANALALAKRIDDSRTSAASVASCSRALAEVLAVLRLRGMPDAPAKPEGGDRLDELAAARGRRIQARTKG
jgi:hypothetical protein